MTDQNAPRQSSRSFAESRLFWAVMLALIFGLLAWGRLNNVREFAFDVPIDDATEVAYTLTLGEGIAEVDTLGEGDNTLFDAHIMTSGLAELDVDDSETPVAIDMDYTRSSALVAVLFGRGRARQQWDIRLHPTPETALSIAGDVSNLDADLRELNLTSLMLASGAGAIRVQLPTAQTSTITTLLVQNRFDGVQIEVPDGATIMDFGITGEVSSVEVTFGQEVSANLSVSPSLGDVTLDIPADAPVRVQVDDPGTGALRLPDALPEIEPNVYESATYADADARLTVRYRGGLGDLTVR